MLIGSLHSGFKRFQQITEAGSCGRKEWPGCLALSKWYPQSCRCMGAPQCFRSDHLRSSYRKKTAGLAAMAALGLSFMFVPLMPMLFALANLQSTAIADECVACQANSRSSALLQKDTKLASLSTELPGLVMWSYGRSATGSFMKSLQKTTGLSFCNGEKETGWKQMKAVRGITCSRETFHFACAPTNH